MIDHVFVDLDDVLADFVGAALDLHGRRDALATWPPGKWDIAEVLGMTDAAFWGPINGRTAFWQTLELTPWAVPLNDALRSTGIPWTIATSPTHTAECVTGKVQWMQHYFGRDFARHAMIGAAKHLLAKPGHVLIDDCDANVVAFREAGGEAIIFPQPWNCAHGYAAPDDKLQYVLSELAELVAHDSKHALRS